MKVELGFGQEQLQVELPAEQMIEAKREAAPAAVADIAGAVRHALEEPVHFPPLRRALTPDDHIVIVLDDQLSARADLLAPVLEHLKSAGITPDRIRLLCATESCQARWQAHLPEDAKEIAFEIHDPADRRHLSYLATTRGGRRIYLNRTAVEADQLVVLTRLGYDPLLGYAGSAGCLFPILSDEPTCSELSEQLSMATPEEADWPVREEAGEVAWLLGAPFMVQVIEGSGSAISGVVGGVADSSGEAHRLLDARWRTAVGQPADTVLAGISGDPAEQSFEDLARALACASRVVRPNGRIILLSRVGGPLGPGADILRNSDDPDFALKQLRQETPPDLKAAFQWASAVQEASVYLLSGLPSETAEELFTTPLENVRQVHRLLESNGTCLVLPDAHKSLAVVEE
jgi:nickel-dependent lactate racemase